MNNLHFIRNDDRIPPADEVALSEDRYGLPVIEKPMLRDLDASDKKKRGERRYHKRFELNENIYALIRSSSTGPLIFDGKSMGCIACAVFNARPVRLGIIDNISMGGLAFQNVDSKIQLDKAFVLDILWAESRLYLAEIPFKIISDFAIPEDIPGDPIKMRQIRLQFQNLSVNQQAKLKDFILNHGAESGALRIKD